MKLIADDSLVFMTVCEQGSFQAAANVLRIASTTVGRRVTHLETVLGTPLFLRSTRQLELTEAGRVYRDRCARLHSTLSSAEDAVRTVMTQPAGLLRVAAPGGVIQALLGEVAIEYAQRYPKVSLDIIGSLENQIPDGEHLHLAVWTSDGTPPLDAIQRTIGSIDMCLCASPRWLASNPVRTPEELATYGCVVLGASREACKIELVSPEGVRRLEVPCAMFTTSTWLTREAALRGVGPAGIPRRACQTYLDSGELVELLPGLRLAPAPVRLVYTSRDLPLRLTAFIDAVLAAFERFQSGETS